MYDKTDVNCKTIYYIIVLILCVLYFWLEMILTDSWGIRNQSEQGWTQKHLYTRIYILVYILVDTTFN